MISLNLKAMASTFDTPPTVGPASDGTKISSLGQFARRLHLINPKNDRPAYPWSAEAFKTSGSTDNIKDSEKSPAEAPKFNLERVERVS